VATAAVTAAVTRLLISTSMADVVPQKQPDSVGRLRRLMSVELRVTAPKVRSYLVVELLCPAELPCAAVLPFSAGLLGTAGLLGAAELLCPGAEDDWPREEPGPACSTCNLPPPGTPRPFPGLAAVTSC
jgi:hypothetical protein